MHLRPNPERQNSVAGQDPDILFHTVVVTTSLVPTERWTTSAARLALPTQALAGRREPAEGWSYMNTPGQDTLSPMLQLEMSPAVLALCGLVTHHCDDRVRKTFPEEGLP